MAPLQRNEVPDEQVWNLNDIFATEADFERAIQEMDTDLMKLHSNLSSFCETDEKLFDFLTQRDAILALGSRIKSYATLQFSEDGTNPDNQRRFAKARRVQQRMAEVLDAFRDALLQQPETRLQAFASSSGPLETYQLYLKDLVTSRAHMLTPAAEAALTAVGETLHAPSTWYRTVTGADMSFESVPDERGESFSVTTFSVMIRSETSYDDAFRKRAYESLATGFRPYHNTLASALSTEIGRNVAMAKLRGYQSTTEMLLKQSIEPPFPADNVPVSFFERVPRLILQELAPHMQRYARLRSRVFGKAKLDPWDLKAPVLNTSEQPVPFSEAQRLITGAAETMGKAYQGYIERAFRERWIYRGDNIGNLQGAFCDPVPGVHAYVFSPYHNIAYDVFILAHELGHAVHGMFFLEEQGAQNQMSSLLFVESPSTFNEHLLAKYMRETGTEDQHLLVNCLQLLTFHHNFVTHLIEAELLRRLYTMADAGEPITARVLDQTQLAILQEFWGDTVTLDAFSAMTWMRQAHYYSGLYPYNYSVGLTGSTVLAQRLEQGEDVSEVWIRALRLGGRLHGLDLFRAAGIEMDADEPYHNAVSYVGRLIGELEAAL